jgi:Lantibiotic biosynthesis dehydratase C-term
MTWRSVHVHYHGDMDALICEAVRPLFAVGDAYYVRHWRRGPHLRMNFRAGAFDLVEPMIGEVVDGFLVHSPSTTVLDPLALLAEHERLARLEADPGPLLPWRPDNSVHVEPYDDRTHVLGSPEAAGLLADFHVATTELAFRATSSVRAGGSRLGVAFDLMIATAHALSGIGVAEGFVSFRSHAEGFLASHPGAAELRPRWDRHYTAHAEALRRRVVNVVSTVDSLGGRVPFVRDWVSVLEPIRARAGELIESGRLTLDTPWVRDNYDPGLRLDPARSAFHRELDGERRRGRGFAQATWFLQYRVMLNYLYLFLTKLGVTPGERYLLCHLAASAVEEAFGVSAFDVITRPDFAVRQA